MKDRISRRLRKLNSRENLLQSTPIITSNTKLARDMVNNSYTLFHRLMPEYETCYTFISRPCQQFI